MEEDTPLIIDIRAPLGIAIRSVEMGARVHIAAAGWRGTVPNGNLIPESIYEFEAARKINAGEILFAKDIVAENMQKKKPSLDSDIALLVEESLEDYKDDEVDPWKERIAEARARREEQ